MIQLERAIRKWHKTLVVGTLLCLVPTSALIAQERRLVPVPVPQPTDPQPCWLNGLLEICPNLPITLDEKPKASPVEFASSSPMPFYAVGDARGDGSSNVYRFAYHNGSITQVVHIGESGKDLVDVAIDPNGSPWGPLYALGRDMALYRVDTTMGSTTWLGSVGVWLNALEFCGGKLYGWGDGKLVVLNPQTGQPIQILDNSSHNSSGDLMCRGGFLYGIASQSGGGDIIVTFSTVYGYSAWVGATLPGTDFYGSEVDGMGAIWAARVIGSTLQLYHVDHSTWAVSFAASAVVPYGLNGLTTYPAAW